MSRKKVASIRPVWPLWLRVSGSVWFAAFLLGTLAVILIASTTIESKLGTPHAQRLIYQSLWFDAFLALLGVNITTSAILRWPFKRKHTGFIITHIGILLLLGGSLLSRLTGVEGQLFLYEGARSHHITSSHLELVVTSGREAGQIYSVESLKKGTVLARLEEGSEIIFSDFKQNAAVETVVEDGGPELNPAIHITLSSEMAGANQSFWLVAHDPTDPDSDHKQMGPALMELKSGNPPIETAPSEESSNKTKIVFHRGDVVLAEIPIQPLPSQPVQVGSTNYRLQNVHYWPDARVGEDNKLTSVSDQPLNPAFEAELVAPEGAIVRIVRFTNFPDFESMHPKPGTARPDFEVELVAGENHTRPSAPTLSFYAGKPWQFRFHSMKRGESGGVIEEGKTVPAGWMDFQFTAERLIERAVVRSAVREVSGENGQPAVYLQIQKNGIVTNNAWLQTDKPAPTLDGQPLPLRIRQSALPVPFELQLKDFRKVDYPGTTRAASFESDVTLADPAEGFTLTRTISMNKPLDYKGYRIFQSSSVDEPGPPEASVFTVAKNPGILWIYSGTLILFLGAFITFFIPTFSSLSAFKN